MISFACALASATASSARCRPCDSAARPFSAAARPSAMVVLRWFSAPISGVHTNRLLNQTNTMKNST